MLMSFTYFSLDIAEYITEVSLSSLSDNSHTSISLVLVPIFNFYFEPFSMLMGQEKLEFLMYGLMF